MENLTVTTKYDKSIDLSNNNINCTDKSLEPKYVYESAKDLNYTPPVGEHINGTYVNTNDIEHKIDKAWICPKCGNYVWDGGEFCEKCEAEQPAAGC